MHRLVRSLALLLSLLFGWLALPAAAQDVAAAPAPAATATPAPAPEAAGPARPALWKVGNGTTTKDAQRRHGLAFAARKPRGPYGPYGHGQPRV